MGNEDSFLVSTKKQTSFKLLDRSRVMFFGITPPPPRGLKSADDTALYTGSSKSMETSSFLLGYLFRTLFYKPTSVPTN